MLRSIFSTGIYPSYIIYVLMENFSCSYYAVLLQFLCLQAQFYYSMSIFAILSPHINYFRYFNYNLKSQLNNSSAAPNNPHFHTFLQNVNVV